MRTVSGISASSMRCHSLGRPRRCSATRNAATTWPSDAPSSSDRSSGMLGPSRLTMRLATLVARISCRRRCARMASACAFCIGFGKAANNCGSSKRIVGQLQLFSIASCSAIFDIDRTTASSGRVRPRSSCPRRSSTSLDARPSTLRSSRPLASSSSIGADQARQRLRAARFGDRQGQRSAAGCPPAPARRPRRSSWPAARCACLGQPPVAHLAVERDLDVHFIVRAIDARRIVDEVGVDPPAMLGELDARRPG